jgi:hypothetical protein
MIDSAFLAVLRAQADEVRRDLAERERMVDADPIAAHDEVMRATRPLMPSIIHKINDNALILPDDSSDTNDDVEPPMFSDEQLDVLAQAMAEINLGIQTRIEDATLALRERIAVLEGKLDLLTMLLGNSKTFEASEVIRKLRVQQ